jgi:hypothetical protein
MTDNPPRFEPCTSRHRYSYTSLAQCYCCHYREWTTVLITSDSNMQNRIFEPTRGWINRKIKKFTFCGACNLPFSPTILLNIKPERVRLVEQAACIGKAIIVYKHLDGNPHWRSTQLNNWKMRYEKVSVCWQKWWNLLNKFVLSCSNVPCEQTDRHDKKRKC